MAIAWGSQLPLNIRPRDDATFDNYRVHSRVQPVYALVSHSAERFLFLHGPGDGGKSHLLQAACHACDGVALYLPLSAVAEMAPADLLEGMASAALICLDDLQAVAGDDAWEHALFNLYNALQTSAARLLIAADAPPLSLAVALPDLRSRLASMLVCAVPAPDDEDRLAILIARARLRGLALPQEVARYIANRAGRSLADLIAVLEELDRASLAHQRGLSIPFVRQIMGWQGTQLP